LQGCKPKESLGVTSHTPGSVEKCEGVNLTLPRQLSLWEMESRWTPETSENDFRGQTQWLMTFFISLESSWSVDVQNGLTFLIWTSETQFMAKRRVGSQITNLTPDQKKSGIDPIYLSEDDVRHIVGKLSTRATTFL